ncbi:MAG: DUF5110 domain-containing protein [Firmicutes bacterium]|nr:DUF5110 domain-containing protein [Bacillota bacterium]
MASFGKHFEVNIKQGKSQVASIKQGTLYRITVLSERLLRLEYSKDGVFNDHPTDFAINRNFEVPKFKLEEDDKYLVISTSYFSLQYLKEKPFKGPSFAPDANLKVKLLNTDKTWYYDHPEARNFNSSAFSLDNFSGGNKKLSKGLYSTDGFVSIEDRKPLVINDIGILNNSNDDNIDLYLFMYKRDFGLCLKDYFTLTGYPTLIPRYALGIWWYRDKIYSFEDTKKLVSAFNSHEIPLSILLLGEFWHTKDRQNLNLYKTGYTFDKEWFPSPTEFTSYMHERGIRVGIQMDPTEGIRKEEPIYNEFVKELKAQTKGNVPFNAFDKMFIIMYFEKIINPLMKMDIDFFWIDYKKDIKSLRALNHYHIQDFKQSEYKRPMLLTRNSGVAAHRNGVLYSGETVVSWDTLKYLPFYNASASNIGLSWWSHDVGGFKDGAEDAELYMRYAQFATFSPIFRFSAKRGIYYKREPWRWDFKTYNIVKDYTQLRHKLIPYLYTEAYKYSAKGLPIIQPLYYSYPETYDEPNLKNEYFFGSELFVSPITAPKDPIMNRAIQRIFIPKDVWYEFKSGKKFIGGKRYVTFYKDEDYPVFAKEGAIVPMANITTNYNFYDNPEKLDIHIFPGKSNTYNLYEDDGVTRLYEQGYYILTSIDYNYMQNNYTVIIHPLEGKTAIIPGKRDYRILFRNTKHADKVEVYLNSDLMEEDKVSYQVEGNDFIVSVKDVDTTKQLTINCSGHNIEIDAGRIVNEDINSIINDLKIKTTLKEELARIAFSSLDIKKKRIEIKKLRSKGLDQIFIKMFMKLYDYLIEI